MVVTWDALIGMSCKLAAQNYMDSFLTQLEYKLVGAIRVCPVIHKQDLLQGVQLPLDSIVLLLESKGIIPWYIIENSERK